MGYLDEDVIYNNIEEKYKFAKGEARKAYSDVLDTICEMPRADVVPKIEVDLYRKQVDELEDELASIYEKLENARADVAREIFYDIEGALERAYDCDQDSDYPMPHYNDYLKEYIDELKKKYTEDNK